MSIPGYAVIDTETTGFSARDRVIEVGIVLLDRDLTPVDTWDTLLNPGGGVGPTHVHHIRPDDVIAAPTFEQAAGSLIEQVAGRVLVGHNVNFDRRMLNQEFLRLGCGAPLHGNFSLDTLQLARQLHLSPTRCYTLDYLCSVHRIDRVQAHAALHDARATAALLRLAARHLVSSGAQSATDLADPRAQSPTDLADLWSHHHAAARRAQWPAVAGEDFRPLSRAV